MLSGINHATHNARSFATQATHEEGLSASLTEVNYTSIFCLLFNAKAFIFMINRVKQAHAHNI